MNANSRRIMTFFKLVYADEYYLFGKGYVGWRSWRKHRDSVKLNYPISSAILKRGWYNY